MDHILSVEPNEDDAALLTFVLKKVGVENPIEVVKTMEEAMHWAALARAVFRRW